MKKDKSDDQDHPYDTWPPKLKPEKKKPEDKLERAQDEPEIDPTDLMVYDTEPEKDKQEDEDGETKEFD